MEHHATTCKSPLCHRTFTPKDSRQQYCSRQCQVEWNNYKAKEVRDRMKPVMQALYNNHKILERILGDRKQRIVSRDYLLGAGFNFNVLTHGHRDEATNTFFKHYFDYALAPVEKGYKIIQHEQHTVS